MKKYIAIIAALLPIISATSCRDTGSDTPVLPQEEEENTLKYVNTFAYNMMQTYYLWTDEVSDVLENWKVNDDPFKKVAEARYKDEYGNDIDRWTQLTDDYETFTSSVAGTSTTYGFDFQLYYYDSSRTTVCAVVTVVYAGSPAEKAGLRRGDCIVRIGGKQMTAGSYSEILTKEFYGKASCSLTLHGGASVNLTQVTMYLDPVLMYKTFNCSGKKVGYLLYNSFTQASYQRLIEVCTYFRNEEISEIILDLRYNGGGYSITEQALASMLAPESDVAAGHVFETEVLNKRLTEAWGNSETKFTTEFSSEIDGRKVSFSTAGANVRLKNNKIYAIVGSGSASASESLIGGLKPYMEIEVIGEQTHGKFCSGIIYSAPEWYNDVKEALSESEYRNGLEYAANWGIYVMVGRYADRDGVTLCMPDGIIPGYEVYDEPSDGHQLGDPGETMLATALALAGYTATSTASERISEPHGRLTPLPADQQPRRPGFGFLIKEPGTGF